jgi:hypothetical protein
MLWGVKCYTPLTVLHTSYSVTDLSYHNMLEIFTIREFKEAEFGSQPDGTPPLYQKYCS